MGIKEIIKNKRNEKKYLAKINEVDEGIIEPYTFEDYLDEITSSFFPKNGYWSGSCFNKPKELVKSALPCHLRDTKWLAKMLIASYDHLSIYSYKDVLHYVRNSQSFNKKRKEYELEIVRWQIDFILGNGENWICDEKYGGDLCMFTPKWDLAFRKGVVDTLLAINMNKDAIEEGLEKYCDIWREQVMQQSFNNAYDPIICNYLGSKKITKYPPVDETFRKAWLVKRKYDYYQKHKASVDLYGKRTPEMTLSDADISKINGFVEQKARKRKEEIEKIDKINGECCNNDSWNEKENEEHKTFIKKIDFKIGKNTIHRKEQ